MQDPQSLTLEDLEDFIDTPDNLNERYTFTVQGGGANEEEPSAETAARDDTEPTQAIDAPIVEPAYPPLLTNFLMSLSTRLYPRTLSQLRSIRAEKPVVTVVFAEPVKPGMFMSAALANVKDDSTNTNV